MRTKEQIRIYQKEWRERNKERCDQAYERYKSRDPEHYKKLQSDWRSRNPDHCKQYAAQWYQKNKKRIWERNKKRLQSNPHYKLSVLLRDRLNKALNGNYKNGSAVKDLGCTIEEFKIHIEKQFKPGMTWNNHTRKGWHLDHIKPIKEFDLLNPEQFKRACHYTNIRPLWWHQNLSSNYIR